MIWPDRAHVLQNVGTAHGEPIELLGPAESGLHSGITMIKQLWWMAAEINTMMPLGEIYRSNRIWAENTL